MDVLQGIDLIRTVPIENLQNSRYLENELLIGLGLNDESIHEQPRTLHQYLGGGYGFKIWQYPNQFSRYLLFLSSIANKINSYLEIGVRFGGTFVLTVEYLKRFNNNLNRVCAVDLIEPSDLLKQYSSVTGLNLQYFQGNSRSQEFVKFLNTNTFDLVLVDGDHSFEGVLSDFQLVKDFARIMVFHDISSNPCPGTTTFWNLLKLMSFIPSHNIHEFTDQYENCPAGGPFLGIGVVDKG